MDTIVEEALKKAEKEKEYWEEIQRKGNDDLMFLSDDPCAQWDERDYNERIKSGKPTLTIDQLSQFVNQVSNDVRMNTPSINVIPADGGDVETAEIIEGKIREIQSNSNADDAYDNAVNFAIKSSLGFIRVDHDYLDDKSFEQELFISRVMNPNSILFDSKSIEPDGSDGKCAFVFENMSKDDFAEEYPDFDPVSFMECEEEDGVMITEYFNIEEEDIYIVMDEMGQVYETEDLPKEGIVRSRKTKKKTVYRYKLSGQDVLEESIFPGEYIPIIPVYGEEAWIDGKRNIYSLIRRSKDAQRMYNYWASLETELLMKAPKAPVTAVEGTVEDYADDWMNPDKAVVMRYKQTDSSGQLAPPPQFNPPVQPPMGIINARQSTVNDIRSTMGLYDSFLGQQDNAISGVAIQGRQREGDRAVYHFMDNLTRSITQVGRILVSAIPRIYDTPRVVQIIGKEETNDMVGINGMIVEGQERTYDLTQGKYAVTVTTGASYATMRQEAAEFFERVIMSQPQLMNIMGDLLFKYSDFPGAQAMSERMKKLIDPNILDEELDAQTMALATQNEELQGNIQMLQAEMANLQKQLEDKQAEIQIKAQSEVFDAEADQRKSQLEIAKLRLEEQKITGELALKEKELELRAYELGLKTNKQANEQLKEVGELALDATERGVS